MTLLNILIVITMREWMEVNRKRKNMEKKRKESEDD